MSNDHKEYEEIVTPVRSVCIKRYCLCGGEFEYSDSGITLASYPPKYLHTCIRCGVSITFDKIYPYIGYEECNKKG